MLVLKDFFTEESSGAHYILTHKYFLLQVFSNKYSKLDVDKKNCEVSRRLTKKNNL